MRPADRSARWSSVLHRGAPFVGVAVFLFALRLLRQEFGGHRYADVLAAWNALPASTWLTAAAFTFGSYVVLVGYDLLALRYVGRRVSAWTMATTSFVANALGNSFGNTLITGAAVRYWTYTVAGLTNAEIGRVVVFVGMGFWLGFLFVGGVALVLSPVALPGWLGIEFSSARSLGIALASVLALYVLLSVSRKGLHFGRWRFELPGPALTMGQIAVAALDLGLAAAALHALLPAAAGVDYLSCVAIYLLALLAGNVSLVPGGLGVFEAAVMVQLSGRAPAEHLLVALLLYRGLYYLAPLLGALVVLGLRGGAAALPRRLQRVDVRVWFTLAPALAAGIAFVAGAVLLFSGAVPAARGRLELLHRLLALPIIEASHFLASLVGAALLLVAFGLQRRLDAAWRLALVLLGAGAVFSLAKGWDFEEAALMALAAVVLLPTHAQFYRRSSLLAGPFGAAWWAAAAMVLATALWLVWFAHRHALELGQQAWWSYALHAEASRSMRATVAACALVALAALYLLIRPSRPTPGRAGPAELERARALVERSPLTYAHLALRGDKALLFSKAGDAFLMYARRGRSWVAMGDPVGSEEGARELRWRFRELSDLYDGWSVFFEVSEERRADYAELGLALTPMGEQARVDLTHFDLTGSKRKSLRQSRTRLMRLGAEFAIVPRAEVEALLPALEHVSRAWLAGKTAQEKGFSSASFDAHYLEEGPVALVRVHGRIVAFANLWLGAGREELSIDLMRHLPEAPNGTMDFLFCELLLWGRAEGYRWFDFGMAPLAGLRTHAESRLWARVGTLLYEHGEHFYGFEGLRRYKAKFDPVWRPLYLASPGGVALPLILVDVTALIAGGLRGMVSKPRQARPE